MSAEFLIYFKHTGLEKKDYVMIKIRCICLCLFWKWNQYILFTG